jgi:hypothetical protein
MGGQKLNVLFYFLFFFFAKVIHFVKFESIFSFNVPTTYMHLHYMTLHSIHSYMFRHYNAIFREFKPSLKHFVVMWITAMNFMAFCTSCCEYQFVYRKVYEFCNVLCTLCICRIITQLNIKYVRNI